MEKYLSRLDKFKVSLFPRNRFVLPPGIRMCQKLGVDTLFLTCRRISHPVHHHGYPRWNAYVLPGAGTGPVLSQRGSGHLEENACLQR